MNKTEAEWLAELAEARRAKDEAVARLGTVLRSTIDYLLAGNMSKAEVARLLGVDPSRITRLTKKSEGEDRPGGC